MEDGRSGAVPGLDDLVRVLWGRRVVVLAGAGCSTESGIPDYRGPDGRMRSRAPMQYGDFVRDDEARRRYWARSVLGWPRVAAARPNAAHRALARLEADGVVVGVIAQNVDGLHQEAGSRRVVELHGSLGFVRCLTCGGRQERARFQERLLAENAAWAARLAGTNGALVMAGVDGEAEEGVPASAGPAPDGDAHLAEDRVGNFRVPPCDLCGGVLKPDVVFFGENVPALTVLEAWSLFAEADALLVAGSSLTVFSGRRFALRAEQQGMPIAIVNLGATRADHAAAARVEERLGALLPRLAAALRFPPEG
jgi:NAD+-dependent protein deacetylase sirtuin 4